MHGVFTKAILNIDNKNTKPLSFRGEGNFSKTHWYSDFDKTYMYYSQDTVCRPNTPFNNNEFNSIYKPFEDLFRATQKGFDAVLTTGRNFPKFSEFITNLKQKQVQMPLQTSVTINNGGEIYNIENAEDFFRTEHPLKASFDNQISAQKREEIKNLTNWDGDVIKSKFTKVLQNFGLDVFDSPINEFSDTYKETILQQLNRRGYNHQSSPFASVQDDGKLGFHIALCKDFSYNNEKLNQIKESITNEIGSDVKFDIRTTPFDVECGNGPSVRILPVVDGEKLDKLYDTKLAVKKILETNSHDLVITTGDNLNDLKMLNPFSYVDLIDKNFGQIGKNIVKHEEDAYNLSTKLLHDSNNVGLIDELNRVSENRNQLLNEAQIYLDKNPQIKSKVENLPLITISVKQEGAVSPVSKEVQAFFKSKTMLSEPSKLAETIKKAMKMYALTNETYAKGLPQELKQILGIGKHLMAVV